MTTIVYKDGIMAADSRAYAGDSMPLGMKRKIRRLKDGTLAGVSSATVGAGEAMLAWLEDGGDALKLPDLDGDFVMLAVRPNGEVFFWNSSPYPSGPLTAPHFAIGSGAKYALSAFAMGASAVRAIEIAAEHDVFTAGPIMTLELGVDR